MTEEEAKDWLQSSFDVPRETWAKLELFLSLLTDEMGQQNLISKSSVDQVWARHMVDSAQLLHISGATDNNQVWLDLGTGAGFPGILIAILGDCQVRMVESRTRRIEFLAHSVEKLEISHKATILGNRLEKIKSFPVDIISARAFAPLDRLIALSHRFSTGKTVWLLPKGKNAVKELENLPVKQQKMFHVEQSVTDPDSGILVGKGKLS